MQYILRSPLAFSVANDMNIFIRHRTGVRKTKKPCYRRENRAMPLWISIRIEFFNKAIMEQTFTYAKHGIEPCRRGRIWRQSQHKTPWITFRGHSRSRILGSLKSRRGTAYYCLYGGLYINIFIHWKVETVAN